MQDILRRICSYLLLQDIINIKVTCVEYNSILDNQILLTAKRRRSACILLLSIARLAVAQKISWETFLKKCVDDRDFRMNHLYVHWTERPHICLMHSSNFASQYYVWTRRKWFMRDRFCQYIQRCPPDLLQTLLTSNILSSSFV